jgi:hypothetical protein
MKDSGNVFSKRASRRSFLRKGTVAAGAATMGAGLLGKGLPAFAQDDDRSGSLTRGDAAILRFLQALETIEADLWRQYVELGGASKTGPFPTAGVSPSI